MTPRVPECPACQRPMQQGYILGGSEGERREGEKWVLGAPEKSFWMGLKTGDRLVLPVATFRCERCGRLESYAWPAPPP